MVDILHRVGMSKATPGAVHAALTTIDGLAGWWTEDTTGAAGAEGDVVVFRFELDGEVGGFDMRVEELVADRLVVWEVVAGPPEWVGTRIRWELEQRGDWTIVLFSHLGWREPVEFMHHCSTKWAVFLLSLKALVEDGVGTPAPRDVKVGDWH